MIKHKFNLIKAYKIKKRIEIIATNEWEEKDAGAEADYML